jgi:hypothetical protein
MLGEYIEEFGLFVVGLIACFILLILGKIDIVEFLSAPQNLISGLKGDIDE